MKHSTTKLCLVIFLFCASFFNPISAQDVEPNNSIATASDMTLNGTLNGTMVSGPPADASDYFELDIDQNGDMNFQLSITGSLSARLVFYRESGTFISQSALANSTSPVDYDLPCQGDQILYVRVSRSSGDGSYVLSNALSTPTYSEDSEPNNTQATTLSFVEDGQTFTGHLGYADPTIDALDYFGLVLPDDGNITVSGVFDSTLTGSLLFYYKNGQFLNQTTVTTGEIELSRSCLAQDTVYLRVQRSTGCGSYSLVFNTDTPPPHDQDLEPNNTIPTANAFIEDGETVEGRMGYVGVGISDATDYYGLVLPDDGNITVSGVFDSTMTGSLLFYYKSGQFLNQTTVTTGDIELSRSCLAQDTVYVRVVRSTGCGSYTLQYDHNFPSFAQDTEPNNTVAAAESIDNAPISEGHLGYALLGTIDQTDHYRFTVVQAPFELDAKVNMVDGLSGSLILYNGSGSFISQTTVQNGEFALQRTLTTAGEYVIRVSRSTGCGSYQLGDLCGLYPTVEATPPGPLNKCPDAPVALDATAGLSAYTWLNDGAPVASTQMYSATSAGDYQVIGYDINGCPDTSAVVIITDINCDDGDPCTDDSCDPVTGCANVYSGDDDNDGTCNNLDL